MPATTVAAADLGLPLNRHRIERAIEALIELLDASEPDPDLEPSLGYNHYGSNDAEGDDEREDDPAECGIADLDGMSEQGFLGIALPGGGRFE